MSDEMIDLYKKLSTNEKRNEFSSLLFKTDKLLDEVLKNKKLSINIQSKNYDKIDNKDMTEDEILTFFYEDLWNIKKKVLGLLISKDR